MALSFKNASELMRLANGLEEAKLPLEDVLECEDDAATVNSLLQGKPDTIQRLHQAMQRSCM
jgi:hypothetical protein